MNLRAFSLLLFFWIGSFSIGFSQVAKYSNEFLAIGVGARALSMGGANIASCSDVTSGYYNPANLLQVKSDIQLGLMHAEYFAGIAKYDYGAVAVKIDSVSRAGLSIIRFGVDNIPNTTQLIDANGNIDYDKITTFNAVDFACLFSYARSIKSINGLNLGGNAKIIRRRLGDFGGAWGFGLDAAATYVKNNWVFSAVGRDITGTFNAWSYTLSDDVKQVFAATGNDIPKSSVEVTVPRLIIGVTRNWNFWADRISVLGEINLVNTFDGKRNTFLASDFMSSDPLFGLELGYQKLVFLRGGLNNIQKSTDIDGKKITTVSPAVGVGIKYKIIRLDYAFTNFGSSAIGLNSHIFSIALDINKKPKS